MDSGRKKKLKIILLGDSGVGKSAWLKYQQSGKFTPARRSEEPKIRHVDTATFNYGEDYSFTCYDTSGGVNSERTVKAYIQTPTSIDGFLIFYNVKDKASFLRVDEYVELIKQTCSAANKQAKLLLIGTNFDPVKDPVKDLSKGKAIGTVSEDEANRKAQVLGMQSYYAVDVKLDYGQRSFASAPLEFVIRNGITNQVKRPYIDFSKCIERIDSALRYCWDSERTHTLKEFKDQLNQFPSYKGEMTLQEKSEMQKECDAIVQKAEVIRAGAYPERVKEVVAGVAAAVLLVTAIACGVAIFNVASIPIFAVLIAACALSGALGLGSSGFSIFKHFENKLYSSIVDKVHQAVEPVALIAGPA